MNSKRLHQGRILIVDDESIHIEFLSRFLGEHGYRHIKSTTDPREAVQSYTQFQPDIVILDWLMPHLSGLQVLRLLRTGTSSYLPIIIVTASPEKEVKNQALANGATDFLTKPYDPAEIVLRVGNLLETRFLHRELEASHEAALHKEREFLGALLENLQEGIVACDANGVLTTFNRASREFHGLSPNGEPPEEWASHFDLYRADGITPMAMEEVPLFRALQGESVRGVEMVIAPRNGGKKRSLLASGQAMFDARGEKLGAVVTMHDITNQRRDEEALQKAHDVLEERVRTRTAELQASEQLLHAFLDNAPWSVFRKDLEGRYRLVNRESLRASGLSLEQIIGKTDHQLFPKKVADAFTARDREVLDDRLALECEEQLPQGDGFRTYAAVKFPLLDGDGEPYAICGIGIDITDRKQAEEKVRFQAQILASIGEAVIVTNRDGQILYANPFAERLYGWPPQEMIGKDVIEVTTPQPSREQGVEIMDALRRGESWSGEFLVQSREGRVFDAFVTNSPLLDDCGLVTAIIGISSDISERKLAEKLLEKQKKLLQAIFDRIPLMISIYDENGMFQEANQEWQRVLGWTVDEMKKNPDVLAEFYPDPSERRRAIDFMRNPNGEWAEFSTRVRTGEIRRTSWTNVSLDDGTRIGIGQDITERKENEEALKAAKDEAERANRAKSDFLSRMSHELRTPMNAILGFAQVLELNRLESQSRECVSHILKAGGHLLALINEVLDLSGVEAGRVTFSIEAVRVQDVIVECLDLIRPLANARALQLDAPRTKEFDAYVLADRQRLKQVVLNLLANAVKYNRDGGSVNVAWEERGAERLQIRVRDTGSGIAADKLGRLFLPFERLGAEITETEGSGLGLALSRNLVQAMGGEIGVESVDGEGSTFWIKLPRSSNPLVEIQARGRTADFTAPAISGTILYIEDNLSNLTLIEYLFSMHPQIKLLAAMQGRLGLEMARQHRPDLILLDLHLPDMMGDEVLGALRNDAETRNIPVAMLTADATPAQEARLRAAGADDYLTKPIDVSRLLKLIAKTLNGPREPLKPSNQI